MHAQQSLISKGIAQALRICMRNIYEHNVTTSPLALPE
jgi:hypothetical protein